MIGVGGDHDAFVRACSGLGAVLRGTGRMR